MARYKRDLAEMAAARNKERMIRSDEREIQKPLSPGKPQKKRGKANSENNHNKPRGWTRKHKSFTNYLARLGMTDEETKQYYATGKFPVRFNKESE